MDGAQDFLRDVLQVAEADTEAPERAPDETEVILADPLERRFIHAPSPCRCDRSLAGRAADETVAKQRFTEDPPASGVAGRRRAGAIPEIGHARDGDAYNRYSPGCGGRAPARVSACARSRVGGELREREGGRPRWRPGRRRSPRPLG